MRRGSRNFSCFFFWNMRNSRKKCIFVQVPLSFEVWVLCHRFYRPGMCLINVHKTIHISWKSWLCTYRKQVFLFCTEEECLGLCRERTWCQIWPFRSSSIAFYLILSNLIAELTYTKTYTTPKNASFSRAGICRFCCLERVCIDWMSMIYIFDDRREPRVWWVLLYDLFNEEEY